MDDDKGLDASRARRELSEEVAEAALHQRAKRVFFELVELPEAERPAALVRICAGDRTLHEEVATLLSHHRHDSLLPAPATRRASEPQESGVARARSPVGNRIGGISIEREVGKGGMSTVYLGHDARLGRRVAVKALRVRGGFDRETRARFLREARVLSRLKHPNICEIYGYEETAEGDYLILEYIDGRSLRDVPTATLPLRERDRIAVALADALQVAHSAGVVHRDLKPENVMLTHDGQVKVLDFGIARMEGWEEELTGGVAPAGENPLLQAAGPDAATRDETPLTRNGRILGTPHYMSPEQARGEPISPASDIFSLGLLLYELYVGRSVHPDDLPAPVLLERVQKGVVDPLEGLRRNRKRLLLRMLSSDAASRPTVTEVAQALRQIRDRRARLIFRGAIAALLGIFILVGVNYVLEITRAWVQAEAARGQLDVLADMLLDDMFNKLSARDRGVMMERIWRLPLVVMQDLPDRLLRESAARLAHRASMGGRTRLLASDTAGAQIAFARMLRLDENTVSPEDDATLRRKLAELLRTIGTLHEGRADPQSAKAFYARGIAFYEHQLAQRRDVERFEFRLAVMSMGLGWSCLQSGDLPGARAAFARTRDLYSRLARTSSTAKQRQFRYLLAEILRALAETEYYAGSFDTALAVVHDSVRGYASVVQEMPFVPDMKASLAEAYIMLGRVLLAQGDATSARAALEKARTLLTPLHESEPSHSRWFTLLAVDHLLLARIERQRGDVQAAQRALEQADTLTQKVTLESLFIAQDTRAQTLLELGRVEDARPLVEKLIAMGWQLDLTHRDFARLAATLR